MKHLVTLHLAGAAATTVIYTRMTHGDAVYIMAMIALYLWVIGTVAALIDVGRDWRDRNPRRKTGRRPGGKAAAKDSRKIS